MHEISLVRNVFNTLHHEFDDETIPKIKRIKIIAGVLSNIEPILMQNAFEAVVATDAPEFKDAILNIEILPVIIECLHCQTKSEIKNYTFICSTCQKPSNNIIQGNELMINGIELEE